MRTTNNKRTANQPSRPLHIAHRKTPSELTPLMVEHLALQQQIEMLQAQQQHLAAQQMGMMPPQPGVPSGGLPGAPHGLPAGVPVSGMPNGPITGMSNGLPPVPNGAGLMPPPPMPMQQFLPTGPFGQFQIQPNHRRVQSHGQTGGQAGSPSNSLGVHGHNRRHSLVLNEAKKAAAAVQQQRRNEEDSSASPAPGTASPSLTSPPTFKFPSDSPSSSTLHPPSPSSSHSRSFSDYRNQSPSRFQFPSDDSSRHHQHQRSNSRNFDGNWRSHGAQNSTAGGMPSSAGHHTEFVPGHRSKGSYNSSSISTLSGYSMYPPGIVSSIPSQQLQQQQQQQQRKTLFAPYLPQAILPELLADGRLVSGVLRVNRKNRSDAYVSTDGLLDADIFICGSKDRNRALEGDLVAVELLEVDEVWSAKKEKEEKKKRKDHIPEHGGNSNASGSSNGLQRKGSLKQRPQQKRNDDVEVEGQSLLLVEEEELSDEVKPLYAGHVVAVIDRVPGQMFSGTLGLLRPSSQATKDKQDAERKGKGEVVEETSYRDKPKIVWFKPTDKRVPLIAIPTEQAPRDFVDNHEAYADRIFVASIKRWPITSLHPFGTLVEVLGPSNDVDIEVEALLRDNNFSKDEFPEKAIKELPEVFNVGTAESFQSNNVIALTTDGCISDEAFSIEKYDSSIELAIHVLDVEALIANNDLSALDHEARRRGTSVFLKQRSVHMFTEAFNRLASFAVGVKSPALSVVFELDAESLDIVDTRMVECTVTPSQVITLSEIDADLDKGDDSLVSLLFEISKSFANRRVGCSGLSMGLLRYIDDESVTVSSNIFEYARVQQMIDEINLQVETAVAQRLHAVLGDKAFLRRQSDPILRKLESFGESIRGLGFNFDTSTSAELYKSMMTIEAQEIRRAVEALFYKCMNRAKYFIAGKHDPDSYGHYLYNLPLYTHFTAPLRRYADIIVQKQLRAVINKSPYQEDIQELSTIADNCNFRKDSAKNAQEQSLHLFLCQLINTLSAGAGQILRDSVIIQVYESAFDILIPELGIEKRVHGDQLPLVKAEFSRQNRLLELFWQPGVDSATFVPENELSKPSKNVSSTEEAARALERLTLSDVHVESKSAPSSPTGGNSTIQRASSLSHVRKDGDEKISLLKSYLEGVDTTVEGKNHIQKLRPLQHVPVLLRAELGKSVPCLTVRAVNPF